MKLPVLSAFALVLASPAAAWAQAVVEEVVVTARGREERLRDAPDAISVVPLRARTVKVNAPTSIGVPEIAPVPLSRMSPAGSRPVTIDQRIGGVPPALASVAA